MRHSPVDSFALPAEQLGITEAEREALLWFTGAAERGEIPPDRFDMTSFCGTACCIGGWVAARLRLCPVDYQDSAAAALKGLYFPETPIEFGFNPYDASAVQAARVVRVFLAGGDTPTAWSALSEIA